MLTRWNIGWKEFDELFGTVNQIKRYLDQAVDGDYGRTWEGGFWSASWPRTNFIDTGAQLVVSAEVPGLGQGDIELTLNQDVLGIKGERKNDTPEGYSAHRQERGTVSFARSFTLPCKINPDRVTASVKDGILTVTMDKAPEAMPRQIKVGA